jgi:Glycosyl transferase family 2
MPVHARVWQHVMVGGTRAIAAIASGDQVFAGFPNGTPASAVQETFRADLLTLRQVGGGLLAVLTGDAKIEAMREETALLKGRNVLVALRNGETPEAALDWLKYHQEREKADAAIIVCRGAPGTNADFIEALGAAIIDVVLLEVDTPLGRAGLPDARSPDLAPGARPPADLIPVPNAWHAPFGEVVLFELLRRAFLARARAVALLDVADLTLPGPEGTVFDRAVGASGRLVPLQGIETYPWRLRQGAPAPHSDHVAIRRNERRWLSSWAAAPADLPEDCVWRQVRISGVAATDMRPAAFRRAMGVVFPGAEVNRIVRKSDLVEDASLVDLVTAAFPRPPIRLPRRGAEPLAPAEGRAVTIVTAMKNEGPFIIDWIAHNRAIGIDRFLVYTNDCADGTDRLLECLVDQGIVEHRENPYRDTGSVPQHAAFRAASGEELVTSTDWLLTLDVDEYINIHAGQGKIGDLFEAVPDAALISMPWRLFGNGDIHEFADSPVVQQFTQAAPPFASRPLQAWAFKTLYRNAGLFRRLGVHRPKGMNMDLAGDIRWVDGSGRPMPPTVWRGGWRMTTSTWGYDLVTLNHYAVRSAESFLVKRDRGRVNHVDRDQGEAYWFRMNHNAEEDTSIRRLDAPVAAEKAVLMALPGVREAHESSVAWHRQRIDALMRDTDQAQLYRLITSPRMEKLSRLLTRFGSNVFLEGPDAVPDEIVARDPHEDFFFTVPRNP